MQNQVILHLQFVYTFCGTRCPEMENICEIMFIAFYFCLLCVYTHNNNSKFITWMLFSIYIIACCVHTHVSATRTEESEWGQQCWFGPGVIWVDRGEEWIVFIARSGVVLWQVQIVC